FKLDEVRHQVDPARLAELRKQYGPDFGEYWKENEATVVHLADYLKSYGPFYLKDAPGGDQFLTKDCQKLTRGKLVFADHCARCHSNKQPVFKPKDEAQAREFYRASVLADDFLAGYTLSVDLRYPVTEIGTNTARATATNAIEGDIWAEFSSDEYKTLKPVGILRLTIPVNPDPRKPPLRINFIMPGGGRGYYRTPSLVSMWATAPYFHNNALGD